MEITDEVVQLRLQLATAQTGKKIADVLGEVRAEFARINTRLDGLAGIKTTVVGTGIAVVVLVIAVLAHGQAWLGIGVGLRDAIHTAVVGEIHPAAPR